MDYEALCKALLTFPESATPRGSIASPPITTSSNATNCLHSSSEEVFQCQHCRNGGAFYRVGNYGGALGSSVSGDADNDMNWRL